MKLSKYSQLLQENRAFVEIIKDMKEAKKQDALEIAYLRGVISGMTRSQKIMEKTQKSS